MSRCYDCCRRDDRPMLLNCKHSFINYECLLGLVCSSGSRN